MTMHFNKRLALGVEGEDRLSNMPTNIIDHILDLMPIQDAARTSILAKNWRNIWVMHPNLVLDKLTCRIFLTNSRHDFNDTVNKILLRHIGNIIKFVLDFSEVEFLSFFDIDTWIDYVIRKNVRELTLNFSNNKTYKLPSYLNCQNMTYLALFNCSFQPPSCIFSCPNLETLYLEKVTFMATESSYVLKCPVLINLAIIYCRGTEFLNVISPQFKYLLVVGSQYCDLKCFMNCTRLSVVTLSLRKVMENPTADERSTLLKFIFGLPMLTTLTLDTFYLKFLSENPVVPRRAPVVLNNLRHITLGIDLTNLAEVSYALLIIQYFFDLEILQVTVFDSSNYAEDVLNYLKAPHNFDRPLSNLKQVVIRSFNGTKPELQLVKLLFGATPSLVRMSIQKKRNFHSMEERKITGELMCYPRASSKAELIYFPSRG